MNHTRLAIISVLSAVLASNASAMRDPPAVPRLLLDRQLKMRAVLLRSVDAETIVYTDEKGLVRSEPSRDFVAVLESPALSASMATPVKIAPSESHEGANDQEVNAEAPATPEPPVQPVTSIANTQTVLIVDLVDRQRLVGTLIAGAASKDTITLRHAILGDVKLSIDQIHALRPRAESPTKAVPQETAPSEDTAILANGDRMTGIVEGIGENLKLSESTGTREIPMDRVRRITFANPPQPRAGLLAWLGDGSIVRCETIHTTRLGEVQIKAAIGGDVSEPIRLEDVSAIAFHAESMAPLAELPPAKVNAGEGWRWAAKPKIAGGDRVPLDLNDIDLSGPLTATWDVPESASRFSAQLELPREAWTWGQIRVKVIGDAKELASCALSGDSPTCGVSIALDRTKRLSVRIESGDFGPAQNRVLLRSALFLIDK